MSKYDKYFGETRIEKFLAICGIILFLAIMLSPTIGIIILLMYGLPL